MVYKGFEHIKLPILAMYNEAAHAIVLKKLTSICSSIEVCFSEVKDISHLLTTQVLQEFSEKKTRETHTKRWEKILYSTWHGTMNWTIKHQI